MTAHEEIDGALVDLRRLWAQPTSLRFPQLGDVDISTILVCREIASADAASEVTIASVAEGLDVTHSTASRLVGRAEGAGAVVRRESAADARLTVVELTAHGRRLHEAATRFRHAYLRELLDGFTDEDVEVFARLLTRFADNVRNRPPQGET